MLPHLKKTAAKCTQGNIFAQKKIELHFGIRHINMTK